MKKLVSLVLALMLALTLVPAVAESAMTITDMAGREVTLDAPARRVVALTAADCEILYAIGAGDTLVGRGEYCDYPAEVLEVEAVNSGAQTNVEQIIALEPQVVIMSTMAQTVEQEEALEAAGIRVLVSDAQTIEGTYEAIAMIGQAVGHEEEAGALVAQMMSAFDAVTEAADATGKTVYFEVSPLQYGLWTAGDNTFMNELAAMCGLTNAFADLDGWVEISEEQVLDRDPDYIVTLTMSYEGESQSPVEEIKSRAGWDTLKAVVNDAIYNADSNAMTRPGPRLADAATELMNFIAGK